MTLRYFECMIMSSVLGLSSFIYMNMYAIQDNNVFLKEILHI